MSRGADLKDKASDVTRRARRAKAKATDLKNRAESIASDTRPAVKDFASTTSDAAKDFAASAFGAAKELLEAVETASEKLNQPVKKKGHKLLKTTVAIGVAAFIFTNDRIRGLLHRNAPTNTDDEYWGNGSSSNNSKDTDSNPKDANH